MKSKQTILGAGLLLAVLFLLFYFVCGRGGSLQEGGELERRVVEDKVKGEEGQGLDVPQMKEDSFVVMPKVNNEKLAREADLPPRANGVYRFAKQVPVYLHPKNSGKWEDLAGEVSRWSLKVHSPGALSLNLGFERYEMPEGGRLRILGKGGRVPFRSFTAEDNEEHGELWTPLVMGEELVVELTLPEGQRVGSEKLLLSYVNHGFRRAYEKSSGGGIDKIGSGVSGTCHIDVVCGAGEVGAGAVIDLYREQTRAVGAFMHKGVDTCTGTLINNTAQDKTPYFHTARHCFENVGDFNRFDLNAASVVVYWNFENSSCRAVGSAENGSLGDGNITQFNTGAIFRAEDRTSDFCLLELDDPIDPVYNLYFAGWDRRDNNATSSVCIHHPRTAEKRITFDMDATSITSFSSGAVLGNPSHFQILNWDFGSTEGGSSGAALFNQNGRIIGQLHGGFAVCGNSSSDWFGRFYTSWEGGGSRASSLKGWLDPIDAGFTALDGIGTEMAVTLESVSQLEGSGGGLQNALFTVRLEAALGQNISVDYATSDGTALAGSDYSFTSGTLVIPAGQTSAQFAVPFVADSVEEGDEVFRILLTGVSDSSLAYIAQGSVEQIIRDDDFVAPPSITSSLSDSTDFGVRYSYQVTASGNPTRFAITNGEAGMEIDEASGLLSWVPPSPGSYSVDVTAENSLGKDTRTLTISVTSQVLLEALGLEGGNVLLDSSTWRGEGFITHDGVQSVQSGAIGDDETSRLSLQVQGPGKLSYWWKVSSEANYDYLALQNSDGSLNSFITGNVDWVQKVLVLPDGLNTLQWLYGNDGGVSLGNDAGWLDDAALEGYAAWIGAIGLSQKGGATDDYDGDGVPNLVEYALGLSASLPDAHLLPCVEVLSGKGRLTVPKSPMASGVNYAVEMSNDLVTWSTGDLSTILDDSLQLIVEDLAPGMHPRRAFFRIKITHE